MSNKSNNQAQISSDNFLNSEQQSKNLSLESWDALTQHICIKALKEKDTESLIRVLQLDRDKDRDKAIEERYREESRGSYKLAQLTVMLSVVTILLGFGSIVALTCLGKSNDSLNTASQALITSTISLTTTAVGFGLGRNSNKQNNK